MIKLHEDMDVEKAVNVASNMEKFRVEGSLNGCYRGENIAKAQYEIIHLVYCGFVTVLNIGMKFIFFQPAIKTIDNLEY